MKTKFIQYGYKIINYWHLFGVSVCEFLGSFFTATTLVKFVTKTSGL